MRSRAPTPQRILHTQAQLQTGCRIPFRRSPDGGLDYERQPRSPTPEPTPEIVHDSDSEVVHINPTPKVGCRVDSWRAPLSNRVGPWAPLNPHRAPPGKHWKNVEKAGGAAAIQATPRQEHCMGVRLVEDSGDSTFYCSQIVRSLYLYGPHCTLSNASITQGRHPQDGEKVAVTVCVAFRILQTAPPPKTHIVSKNTNTHKPKEHTNPRHAHLQLAGV